ncbi:pentapeptide repeat-containing protein [Candidatus Leptofilum sp.]|uniref:pentapeptide repeat-containing protein n=1 Tax=Candidatus Leptofilum sp. TaxID=3241576 RepID=UPI003B5922A5
MTKRILVAYASGSGSTREVAEAIAAEIEGDGLKINVQEASQVENISIYHGIILGSSIRIGRWLPEAVACVERIQEALPEKLVAYFTTCLTMIEDSKESRDTVLDYMKPVLNLVPDVNPIGLGLFAGSLDPQRRAIITGGPHGDYRNWDAIRAWAKEMREIFLSHADEEAFDLTETILSFTDMSYSDLSRVDLQGAKLHASYLVETNFEGSHLAWADLSNSQLQGANLSGANLIGSILTKSNLREADLAGATLNGAVLQNASLVRANLAKADMNWVDLSQADLTGASLQRARLGWAKLTDAIMDGADLTGARYNEHTVWPEGFSPEDAGCINVGRGAI